MLKQRIITAIAGAALLLAIAGSSGIVADWLGLSVTPSTFACQEPSGAGGGC